MIMLMYDGFYNLSNSSIKGRKNIQHKNINKLPSNLILQRNKYSIHNIPSMDIFQTKIRGFHAKAIENIMARTTGKLRQSSQDKSSAKQTDNISTYLRKFEIDRENLNLAKRIILCESEHNHKKYKREWKKTKNFLRVRSNFKRSLCNEEPRIFKFQPITGKGGVLLTLTFKQIKLNPISFRPQKLYELKVLTNRTSLAPTNNHFTLETLQTKSMAFYVQKSKKSVTCKITELKENNTYEKGKFTLNITEEGEQEIELISNNDKVQGTMVICLNIYSRKDLKSKTGLSLIKTGSDSVKRSDSTDY